jgi:hypothetical protein
MAKQATLVAAAPVPGAFKKRATATAATKIAISRFTHPQPEIWKVYSRPGSETTTSLALSANTPTTNVNIALVSMRAAAATGALPSDSCPITGSMSRALVVMASSDLCGSISRVANRFGICRWLAHGFDAGIGLADPSIVDRITTGVDITADNTAPREMSPPTANAGHSPWRSASQPLAERSCRIGAIRRRRSRDNRSAMFSRRTSSRGRPSFTATTGGRLTMLHVDAILW